MGPGNDKTRRVRDQAGFVGLVAGGRDRLSLNTDSGKQGSMVAGAIDRRSLRGRIPGEYSVPCDPTNPLSLLFNAYDLTNVRKDGAPSSNP